MKRVFFICTVCLLALSGCKKDNGIKISNGTEVSLYRNDTHQISATSSSTINYTSDYDFCAEVNSAGLITANHVGKSVINLRNNSNQKKTVKVTVKATSNLYPEPNIEFGASKNAVTSRFGQPNNTDGGYYTYTNYSSAAPILAIEFENGKVKYYYILVKASYASELGVFLSERYEYYLERNDILMFGNALSFSNASIIVAAKVMNTSYIAVMYQQKDSKGKDITKEINKISQYLK